MRHDLHGLPPLVVPAGYSLRPLAPGDVDAWAELLAANGELGTWNHARAAPYFSPSTSVVLAHSYFVMHGETPVATAQLELHPHDAYTPTAELGWVAVTPEQRGHGLAYLVCLAVLHGALAMGQRGVFLRTDDHRTPAIATYLRLGFEPWLRDSTAASRWAAVLRA
jgi:mycothiol synthase